LYELFNGFSYIETSEDEWRWGDEEMRKWGDGKKPDFVRVIAD
jgi:hypothetical protein